jgi:hypothetical protein
VQTVQRMVESMFGWSKKNRMLLLLYVVMLGTTAGVWAVARLVLETWFQR